MVRETARRRATRGAALVEYALVLALLVVAAAGSIRYLEDETGKEVDNQADCISERPPPESCLRRQVPPLDDPDNPGGPADPGAGGDPTAPSAVVLGGTVVSEPPPPGGRFDVEIAYQLADPSTTPPTPISGQVVGAQITVTASNSASRVGEFFYANCTTTDTGECLLRFRTPSGDISQVEVRIISVGVDVTYQFDEPPPVVVGR